MFFTTALVYPCVLAVLCAGAGLLVDRCSGGEELPASLLLTVGAAALIAICQLTTYFSGLAPTTPYVMAVATASGLLLGRERLQALWRRASASWWQLAVPVIAYAIAMAPVLLAGRTTFSSFMALGDSAFHMLGADFLIRHGQDYSHLDLRNSYGLFVNNYYKLGYPTGADALFGGSSFLLGLPVIWTFQPFNAFMLAIAGGPAWLLARRLGLDGLWAALATLTAVLGALVYAYELIGSIKEVSALSMILTLGTLVVLHRRWLRGAPAAAIPFALVAAAGISALGPAFGVWALVAVAILAVIALGDIRAGRQSLRRMLLLIAAGAGTALIAAGPTWIHASRALQVAQNIANTGNPGNLHAPLRATQVFGVWLLGSYKLSPVGNSLLLTQALIVVVAGAAVLGAVQLLRTRAYPLAAWLGAMIVAWLGVTALVTTWASAKTLMLTSPVVVLLAWAGLAWLRASRVSVVMPALGWLAALALVGGVAVSDALQYRDSNLAPTKRYQELASINSHFAGKGPTLFTDFDEYSMYELRDMDVGGADFAYPPPALAALAHGYGHPVELDRAPPRALLAYPLIVTRRDPAASRPPSAYSLVWQGAYYQVWRRQTGAPAAIAHIRLTGSAAEQCPRIHQLADTASALNGGRLIAADAPELVRVSLEGASYPAGWGHEPPLGGLVMKRSGQLSARFELPAAGVWDVWFQGHFMPKIDVAINGRALPSIGGELSGNSLVPDTVPAIPVRLAAGPHRLSVTRLHNNLAPGDNGWAALDAVFLTPVTAAAQPALSTEPVASWHTLCGRQYQWIELLS
jgi:hypothetical protein